MPGLIVKPRSRIFHGHDWVYASEIRKTFGDPKPGDVISLKDYKDRPLGSAIFNPQSQIVARRFSRRRQDLDTDFFRRRLERARNYRATLALEPADYCRLVWSESDGLPGVVIDRFGGHLVLQSNTLAMDQRKHDLLKAMVEVFQPQSVIERNDSPIRTPEGLEPATGVLHGTAPPPFRVTVGGASLTVDLLGGQKTGLYLDQLDNYGKVASLAQGNRVLDCFANQGGFALACRAAGAASVIAVESSAEAVSAGRENAAASELDVDFVEANVFDYLKAAEKRGETQDLIVLDPPSFARSKKHLRDALRGYKEIHLRALKLLEPGGRLVTFSCSHHLDAQGLRDVIADASVDAKRQLRVIETYGQRRDHPVIATIPETEYLKGFALETMASW